MTIVDKVRVLIFAHLNRVRVLEFQQIVEGGNQAHLVCQKFKCSSKCLEYSMLMFMSIPNVLEFHEKDDGRQMVGK